MSICICPPDRIGACYACREARQAEVTVQIDPHGADVSLHLERLKGMDPAPPEPPTEDVE